MDKGTSFMGKRLWGLLLILVLLLGAAYGCKQEPEALPIGLAINLSGGGGAAGAHIRDGALLAVSRINDNGGVKGRPLELLVEDDRNTPTGVRQADYALLDAGVPAILGHSHSANTLLAYPLVTMQDTLLVTAYAATTQLSGRDDLFLRTSVDCRLYGEKAAALLKQKQVENVKVLMDMSNAAFVKDYYQNLRLHFTGTIQQVRFSSQKQTIPWTRLTQRLLAGDPDGIFLLTEASMTGLALQRLQLAGYQGQRLATLWAQTPELFQAAGETAANGLSIITFIEPHNERPAYQKFARGMRQGFNKAANARSARAYELVHILADAMRRSSSDAAPAIKKALLAQKYETLLGKVAFDKYGDVKRPVYEVVVRNGDFHSQGPIK